MKVVTPRCRKNLSEKDLNYICSILTVKDTDAEALPALLEDESMRDLILDTPKLYNALFENNEDVSVSAELYFYLLVRKEFRSIGLDNSVLADYVASMLAEFSNKELMLQSQTEQEFENDYVGEMLEAIDSGNLEKDFLLRAHIGNYTLFITGVYPNHIAQQAACNGTPHISYYEAIGSASFRTAAKTRMADEFELKTVFKLLAQHYHPIRIAMNKIAEQPDIPGKLKTEKEKLPTL